MDPDACESTGECEPAPGNIEITWEKYCEMYPEYCGHAEDCEEFPELCDPELYCEMYPDNCITYEEYCAMYPEDPLCESYGESSNSSQVGGCITDWIGDGWCDAENNNEACGWDDGDCCASTCIDSDYGCSESFMVARTPTLVKTPAKNPVSRRQVNFV